MCKVTFDLTSTTNKEPSITYKFQEIRSLSENVIIGFEFLINASKLSKEDSIMVMTEKISEPKFVTNLINTISFHVDNGNLKNTKYSGKKFFINIERNNICDKYLLGELGRLSKNLGDINIELIIEITERNFCGECKKVKEGLDSLSIMGIPLAADDYDIYNGDFRDIEIVNGTYSYIKVKAPQTHVEKEKIIQFSSKLKKRKEKLIVENVETLTDLNILEAIRPFGVQGFLFHKGEPFFESDNI
ncbi:EAL domain-containing protein [Vibrio harveyi]